MAQVNISELKKQLMERIDIKDLVEVEKVERYIELVKAFRKCNSIIKKEGESITVENGAQRFTKAHPLMNERKNISASLLSIEKSFSFNQEDNDGKKKTKTSLKDMIRR